MLYKNVKTGNILAPANRAQEVLMAGSPVYEPVKPIPMKVSEPPAEPPAEPPGEPPKEPAKAPKNKKE